MGLAFGQHLRRALKRGNLIEAVGDDCSFDFSVHQVGNWRKKVGAKAAERLPNYLALTRSLAEARLRRLNVIPHINVLADVEGGEGVWPFFIIRMPNEVLRDAVLSSLWDKGLGVGRLFIHALKDYGYLAPYFKDAQTPNAQQFASQTLIITNCIWLSEHDFAKICEVISEQVAHV
jgi:dTDP-4-amino-4,6-dideoxygalactose transaminase